MIVRALLAVALAVVLAPPAHALEITRGPDPTGVSVNGLLDTRGRLRPLAREHARAIRDSGIHIGRSDAVWGWAEPWKPSPVIELRSYEWGAFDRLVGLLAINDIQWFPLIAYSAGWASSVRGSDRAPPVNDADYFAYAQAFARRYGRGGSFWWERSDLPALPVTDYEIWNEPNLAHFWQPKPDPARYAGLYLGTRAVLREVDPDARVVMGGMHAVAADYVREMYAARPDLRGSVDVFAYHPYAEDAQKVLALVQKMRATLDGLGETHVPMWITELGWPTRGTGGLSARPLPDATRAANLSLVTDALLGSNCYVQKIHPYTWVTPETDPDHDEQWLGIYRADGTPTEAGRAYRESVERNANAVGKPRPALRLCGGAHRGGGKFAAPLSLGLGLRDAGRRCFEAVVTYRGRPLNGVAVAFTGAGGRASVRTGIDGAARRCPGRTAVGHRLTASARVLDVAASKAASLRVR